MILGRVNEPIPQIGNRAKKPVLCTFHELEREDVLPHPPERRVALHRIGIGKHFLRCVPQQGFNVSTDSNDGDVRDGAV